MYLVGMSELLSGIHLNTHFFSILGILVTCSRRLKIDELVSVRDERNNNRVLFFIVTRKKPEL